MSGGGGLMIFDVLPTNPAARREAETMLRTSSGLVVVLMLPAGALLVYTVSPEHLSLPLGVIFIEIIIAGAAYINARLNYRLYPASVTLMMGVISLGLGITAAVHFRGSASSMTPALYILFISMMTVYMTPQAGFLCFIVSIFSYGALQGAEMYGVLAYAPLHPDSDRLATIQWGPTGRILELSFLCAATYITAFYISLTLSKRRNQVEAANEKLRELDKTKSRFLSIVSHDLRSPITSIRAYAELLSEQVQGEYRRFSDTIVHESDRLNRLVTDLLDLDKMEAGKMEWVLLPHDIGPVLENSTRVFSAAAQEKEVSLVAEIEDSLPSIRTDPDRLAQLVANLLSNAIKFTPNGGTITLSAIHCDSQIEISVADTGPGIAQDDIDSIFDRFSQTDTGKREGAGTGLGLAIAKEITAAHDGELTVTSTLGEGTTFTVSLPCADKV